MPFDPIDAVPSARLTLRPVEPSDLPDLLEINGDAQVTRFLPYPTWSSLDDGAAWLARMQALAAAGTGQQLVLERKADGKVVGTLLLFKFDEGSARLELGYVLARSAWGQGLMHEGLCAICGHLFTARGVRRLEAEVNPDNAASNRLLQRLGFTLEGRLRGRWVAKGVPYDTNVYGCLAEEWPRVRQEALEASRAARGR